MTPFPREKRNPLYILTKIILWATPPPPPLPLIHGCVLCNVRLHFLNIFPIPISSLPSDCNEEARSLTALKDFRLVSIKNLPRGEESRRRGVDDIGYMYTVKSLK